MLCDQTPPRMTPFDNDVFALFVPESHVLRQAKDGIDWQRFRPLLAPAYSPDQGRPSDEPLRLLKLELLRYQYELSDGAVVERAKTDIAFRYFLDMDSRALPPNSSTLSVFRGRVGAERFRDIFNELVAQARELGIVKDRLRLKDATHVIASVAIPSAIALVAQIRDKLLANAQPWASVLVEGERINAQLIRERTNGRQREQRLLARVNHLHDILIWADELVGPNVPAQDPAWCEFVATRELAHKILSDHQRPEDGDCTRSIVDPEVRRSKHGDWYDGYILDVIMDADSELITSVNVLPANGNEAMDAVALVQSEEESHGNKVDAISIDGVGYNGPLLKELQDPSGLALETFVPPRKAPRSKYFTHSDFKYDSENNDVVCPAGQHSRYCQRDKGGKGWIFRFTHVACTECPLLSQCMKNPPKHFGKAVHISEYHDLLQGVHEKAKTESYATVRSEHAKVERKLGDIVNNHGGRRARYRGTEKTLVQETMACFAANVSRVVRLLCAHRRKTTRISDAKPKCGEIGGFWQKTTDGNRKPDRLPSQ